MESDINGCSTCPNGKENHESFYSEILNAWRVQYDYRTPNGKLFSTVAKTLEQARNKRDAWLKKEI